jgi:hypothetical protein
MTRFGSGDSCRDSPSVAETGFASAQVLAAAQALSGDSNRLRREVGMFLISVRAS